jgi:lipoprotein-anchoring transpeptidase ErfK/SrfK
MRLFDLFKRSLLILPVALLLSAAFALAETGAESPSARTEAQAQTGTEVQTGTETETDEATRLAPASEESEADAAKPEDKAHAVESEKKFPDGEAKGEAATAEAGSKILVNIDKSEQHMTVFVDGIEKYSWPVSTGLRGYSTPSGNFTASSMNKIWYSKQWDNAPMPHAIFFTKDGHAIHGTNETKNLGRAASHGCVRLAPKNAQTLFDLVKANGLDKTTVVLAGVTPGGEAKIAKQQRQYPRYGEAEGEGWFGPGYYPPRQQRQRRGLFGRRLFDPYGGPQGYYRPPRGNYRGY